MKYSCIIEFEAFNPRKNLPLYLAQKRREANFVAAFERHFVAKRNGQGVGGKYFSLSGYGIADFVWIEAGNADEKDSKDLELYLIAFELKLRDWKRAISQAHRYSYFADSSIVVLPPIPANIATSNIELFKKTSIGLWMFDPVLADINIIYQPSKSKARNPIAKEKALSLFSRKTKFRNLFK